MPEEKLPIPQFAAKIKAKYPAYKDVNDTLLVEKILAKYPEYNDQVNWPPIKKKEPSKIGSLIGGAVGNFVGRSEKENNNIDPSKYETKLSPQEESKFQIWLDNQHKEGKIEKGDYDFYKKNGYGYGYDFRAAFEAGEKPQISKVDGKWHWDDIGKKPNHSTFSNQSKYHNVDGNVGGTWDGEVFTPATKNGGKGSSTKAKSVVPPIIKTKVQETVERGKLKEEKAVTDYLYGLKTPEQKQQATVTPELAQKKAYEVGQERLTEYMGKGSVDPLGDIKMGAGQKKDWYLYVLTQPKTATIHTNQ